jgi:prolyl-tRNA editing enzyme YbaK/EbsC (Cys-tRNA(Pro) deacylase)
MSDNIQLDTLDNLLKGKNADYSIFRDDFSLEKAADGAQHYGISLNETTPTFILKTNDMYYAAIICGNTRISFKKLKLALSIKDIRMADPETVLKLTGAKIGEVCLINFNLPTLIDHNVLKNINCYGGCGAPKSTLKINTQDLIRITNAKIFDFTEEKS